VKVTDVFVLPEDVVLLPIGALAPEQRDELEGSEGDVAITHARGRTQPKLLDADTAQLVEEFRDGRTIVDAVVRFLRRRGTIPRPRSRLRTPPWRSS